MATILVVDDTAMSRVLVASTLEGMGYKTVMASDGKAAIEALDQFHPDAIVTDLEMPNVGGDELIYRVRSLADVKLSDLPILVVSSKADLATLGELQNLGVNGFIAKPVDTNKLRETVARLFIDP
ncbi:response regulator [Aporhodopirellula aestuarii]|uniref:Response regulator n=1 Tax=Aporhodopirellula aestuarii TaxID=2950107 RepID=A0ABT0UDC3_9BACT|nr:response regulator [Aporhodopirellula aestuarii]MCM2374378.1 response regulator [Aporhodopirellula aestuarii]